MKIALNAIADAAKVGRLTQSLSRAELTSELARIRLVLPEYTKLATDKVLYPDSTVLGYGAKLEVEPGARGSVVVSSSQTQGTSVSSFHRVVLSRTGEAVYYPNSYSGIGTASDGASRVQEILSRGIEVPKAKRDLVLLATASRKGDLLDVLTRKPTGKVQATSYQLVGSTLNKVTTAQAEKIRFENIFRPAGQGTFEGLTPEQWALTVPATPAKQPVYRDVQRPATRPVATAPATQPRPANRPNPNEFWTVDRNQGGSFTAYSGDRDTGIAVGQATFNTREEADAFIAERKGDRLLFVNADRNAPVFK